jgi:hypothetical protein
MRFTGAPASRTDYSASHAAEDSHLRCAGPLSRGRARVVLAQPLLPRLSGEASCKQHYVDGWYATRLRAIHPMLIAVLPGHARWLTKSLNALVARRGLFSRHEKIFPVTATVVTAGEEPGGEEHREGQYDEYDNGDEACPDPPVCSLGRIGRRGRSCRFVWGLQCLGRAFITRHAAVLSYNRERNCAVDIEARGDQGAARVLVLMTSLSIWSVIRVVVLSCGLCNLLAHTRAFPVLPSSRELRLDGANGVRPVASIFDGLARRADLESEHERRNALVTTSDTPDTILDHDTPGITFAVAVLVIL